MTPDPADENNPGLYRQLKDVLNRQPQITDVRYEPDAIQKRYLGATVDPNRVEPPTGPDPSQLTVKWKTIIPSDKFWIDYADPNISFHCGWHRDDSHPELGPIHIQYDYPGLNGPVRESVQYECESPPRLLWACLTDLFEDVIPVQTRKIID
jgi:hypothetical protein